MPISPSQMIPNWLDWRQIWESSRPRKKVTVPRQSCDTLAIRLGSIPLQSNFLVRCTTPNGGVDSWVSRAAHIMGTAIPNVLQPDAFVWFEKTHVPLMKVLLVPGWLPTKQLAVRVHFLRCSGLLDDWSVKGVLSLVFG
ncbi:uncharacterized protein TNCV_310981 [Trichonephila clavipes]|nr:uncharacterized protein TNCV_310981 [Trichonephila clavipes]